MCANYKPVTAQDRLTQYFGVERPADTLPPEVYPGGLAPFIVRHSDRIGLSRDVRLGLFGLLPTWAKSASCAARLRPRVGGGASSSRSRVRRASACSRSRRRPA